MRTIRMSSWKACGIARLATLLPVASVILLSTSVNASWAQSVSLFAGAVPATLAAAGTRAVTLGVKFWSSQPGTISGISFYRGTKSPHGYVASLYTANGSTVLGAVQMATESGPVPGWQHAVFPTPISLSANTTYVAAYYAPGGQYAYTHHGLTAGVTVGPLSAPASSLVGGNGVYNYSRAFPNRTYENTNYFVDVVFVQAAPAPYLTLALNPPNPSIASTAPLGTHVAMIAAVWSDGSPFMGTLSLGPPYFNDGGTFAISGNNLIINPSGPGVSSDGGTLQNVTIVATQ